MFYAIATLPLVIALRGNGCWFQIWHADDSACAGPLVDLRHWLDRLLLLGPSYGYFLDPHKIHLIVAPQFVDLASDTVAGLGISIVSGHPFLGGLIGEPTQCEEELMSHKVDGWIHSVGALAGAARKSPQAAFAAMVKSLQFEWSYIRAAGSQ